MNPFRFGVGVWQVASRAELADNGVVPMPFPSPTVPAADRAEVFLGYLDYFREAVTARVLALPDDEASRSRLPSGWSPLELVKHLRYVELRWIEWASRAAMSVIHGVTSGTTAGTSSPTKPAPIW